MISFKNSAVLILSIHVINILYINIQFHKNPYLFLSTKLVNLSKNQFMLPCFRFFQA